MENKYKEALGVIEKALIQKLNASAILIERTELNTLHELVDKATPKKVKVVPSDKLRFDGLCPNCNQPLFDGSDMFFKEKRYQFCDYCGQALDWSKDNG